MSSSHPTQHFTLTDEHGADLAEYVIYPEDSLLCVHWHGHLTGAEIVRGVKHGSSWRDQFTYTMILNDKRDTSGDWSDALPWLQYEWLPEALKGGLKALAYVFSPAQENRFATQQFVEALRPHVAIELFDDPAVALDWLKKLNHPTDDAPAGPSSAG
ncbi:hypothetical protein [Hymenobacter sp. IS2118]|uniref:hypothetical protein n=1 Tax=Hymenobacter sp. IS2118 TaxID=1505605 RepID=UPI0005516E73|nr:hypothetical protein [Hymenobacter sp. IS2118]